MQGAGEKLELFVIVVCLTIALLLNRYDIHFGLSLESIPAGMFFLGVGHYFKRNINDCLSRLRTSPRIIYIMLVILFALSLTRVCIESKTGMANNGFVWSDYLYALVGSSLVVLFSFILKKNSLLEFVGQNTLVVLSIHMCVIQYSLYFVAPLVESHLIYKIVEQILIWVTSLAVVVLVNSYLPWAAGKQRCRYK